MQEVHFLCLAQESLKEVPGFTVSLEGFIWRNNTALVCICTNVHPHSHTPNGVNQKQSLSQIGSMTPPSFLALDVVCAHGQNHTYISKYLGIFCYFSQCKSSLLKFTLFCLECCHSPSNRHTRSHFPACLSQMLTQIALRLKSLVNFTNVLSSLLKNNSLISGTNRTLVSLAKCQAAYLLLEPMRIAGSLHSLRIRPELEEPGRVSFDWHKSHEWLN